MKTPVNAAKLAICLQVCPLDVWTAQRLARLITSIEPGMRDDIECIVSARRGTNPQAANQLVEILRKTFSRVFVIKGKRFGTGWPNGCNDLWQETMMRISQMKAGKRIGATGVLTFEADCIPLRPDWLDFLASEWSRGREDGAHVVGHAHTFEGQDEPQHINGNAIFSTIATETYPQLNGCSSTQGWDAYHGKLLLSIGRDTNAIFQKYRIKNITREEVEAIRKNDEIPAIFHGIKGTDGLAAVEGMVADKTFFNRQ
jgi:hypothetical protein